VTIRVRPARTNDAAAMSDVLVASITELCSLDHGNDPRIIAAWTANKTPEGVLAMLASPETIMFVAERDGQIVGVGALTDNTISLNYVSPKHQRTGVSSAMLAELERILAVRGVEVAQLKSTATARDFYRAMGWSEMAPPREGRFISSVEMQRKLR